MRFWTLALAAAFAAACGGASAPEAPSPQDVILRPLQVYRQLGLMTGSERFPAVASFSSLAGPADSTYVVFGLSLPNSALRFERDDGAFTARYTVSLSFQQDSQVVRKVDDRGVVRVASFAETSRTDESVVYQTVVALTPGRYTVEVEARDGTGSRGFRSLDTLNVPAYRAGERRMTRPIFVYRAEARAALDVAPEVIVNPRHTVPFGGEAPRMYLEAYGYPAGHPVQVRMVNDEEEVVWRTEAPLAESGSGVRYALVDIPTGSLPLGRFWIEATVDSAGTADRVPLVVTISDQWMVANFEEVFEFLSYIGTSEELDSLREATGDERAALWERFWARRDPLAATPANEFREQFFERIRLASLYFDEPGLAGWKTDRGEVFIVLGQPDFVRELRYRGQVTARPRGYEWTYERSPTGRLVLVFVDRNGFERYELTPVSQSSFRAAASRIRRRR
ncbi:MAG TPA: GWxTD domain-containing protein [Longimicrobiales bacterium]